MSLTVITTDPYTWAYEAQPGEDPLSPGFFNDDAPGFRSGDRIEIRWPDGGRRVFRVRANQYRVTLVP